MSRLSGRNFRSSSSISVGWLFADLLLALAMIFLLANTIGSPAKAKPKTLPTPTPTLAVATPTTIPRLELNFHEVQLRVDSSGLLNNSPIAINDIKKQLRSQSILQKRTVGLVIAYGGAPNDNAIGRAQLLASKVYDILKALLKKSLPPTKPSKKLSCQGNWLKLHMLA